PIEPISLFERRLFQSFSRDRWHGVGSLVVSVRECLWWAGCCRLVLMLARLPVLGFRGGRVGTVFRPLRTSCWRPSPRCPTRRPLCGLTTKPARFNRAAKVKAGSGSSQPTTSHPTPCQGSARPARTQLSLVTFSFEKRK